MESYRIPMRQQLIPMRRILKLFLKLFHTYFEDMELNVRGGSTAITYFCMEMPSQNTELSVHSTHTHITLTRKDGWQKPYVIICYLYVHEMQSLKIIFPEEWKKQQHEFIYCWLFGAHIMHTLYLRKSAVTCLIVVCASDVA